MKRRPPAGAVAVPLPTEDEKRAVARAKKAEETLALLLHFEPALRAYRRTRDTIWGEFEEWDVEGMQRAKEARQVLSDAERYSEPVLTDEEVEVDR